MAAPEITIGIVSNVYSRQMTFVEAGDSEAGHTHNYDHITLLAKGSLRIDVEGESYEAIAPRMLFIHKDKRHTLTALEPGTVAYCIHAVRDKHTGDVVDPSMAITPSDLHKFKPALAQGKS
jgi:quercetin dioxygenase-like cupin family protein